MKIVVVGTGYVGLVAGAGFADLGHSVTCVDVDKEKIERLSHGEIPIYEPGLDALVAHGRATDRLHFTTDLVEPARSAELIFIAVGTPSGEDGSADVSHVLAVAREIGPQLQAHCIVVDKSTVPVGTGDRVREEISRTGPCSHVASNPEFLKEGHAVEDFLRPDRVVIGSDEPYVFEILRQLYTPLVPTSDRILCMDLHSAELTKYAANAMLGLRISYMNEIARLAEAVGADIKAVRLGIGSDARIGREFLYAGLGWGGSCFAKDIKALQHTAHEHDIELRIVGAAEAVNTAQRQLPIRRLQEHFGSLEGKLIAVWGLAFKPQTDDLRDSPALTIIDGLIERGAHVTAYDPVAMPNARQHYKDHPQINFVDPAYGAALDADALILATEWREFRQPDFEVLKRCMGEGPVIFDGRNIWDAEQLRRRGFVYYGIGRS